MATINGTNGDDSLVGTIEADVITGEGGNDIIDGSDGNDVLVGDGGSESGFATNELLTNPDFAGNATGWDLVNVDGRLAPRYFASGDGVRFNYSNDATYNDYIQQSFGTVAGENYTATVDLAEFGAFAETHTAIIEVLDVNGNVLGTQTVFVGDGETPSVEIDFVGTGDDTTLRIINPTSTDTVFSDLVVTGASVIGPDPTQPNIPGDDTISGGEGDDQIFGNEGNDDIFGGGDDDSIDGGDGDDYIFGDSGSNAPPGSTGTPVTSSTTLVLNPLDVTLPTGGLVNNALEGDSVIFNNAATGTNGESVSVKLTLTSKDTSFVDLVSPNASFPFWISGGGTASYQMEFFDPVTGDPVEFTGTFTLGNIDSNESIALASDQISGYSTNAGTTNTVTDANGQILVEGGGGISADPFNPNAYFTIQLDGATSLEFTLDARSTITGYSTPGADATGTIITPDPDPNASPDGNDVIDGGDGNDTIFGEGGDDTITGGAGNDTIDGGDGADSISAGDGQDSIEGGAGNDIITGGGDNDTLSGGDDADTIIIDTLGSNGVNNTVVFGGSGGDDNDTLDVSSLIAQGFEVTNLVQNPENNGNPGFNGQIQLVNTTTGESANINFSDIENIIICFTPGTAIATPQGERDVATLREGDKVFTRDNGIQEIRWVGRRDLGPREMTATPSFQPVMVKAGSLGGGLPERDLLLSPNHRLLLNDERASLYFEENEVLLAAKHLTGMDGIDFVERGTISYIHLLFDRHEVVLSNGAWTETFQPGDYSLKGIRDAQRNEIFELFPELQEKQGLEEYQSARRVLRKHEAKLLAM